MVALQRGSCELCKAEHPDYYVHNHLWLRFAKQSASRMFKDLCLKCLGIRMGRPVKEDDLKPGVPANFLLMVYWSQNDPKRFSAEFENVDKVEEGGKHGAKKRSAA